MLKEEFDSSGNLVHYAVLALIEDNGKYFLVLVMLWLQGMLKTERAKKKLLLEK